MTRRRNAYEAVIDAVRQTTPCVILDMPHGWTPWIKACLLAADDIVIVATPDLASLRNAKNIIELVKHARPNDAPPRLVINQVGMPKRPEIPAKDFAETMGAGARRDHRLRPRSVRPGRQQRPDAASNWRPRRRFRKRCAGCAAPSPAAAMQRIADKNADLDLLVPQGQEASVSHVRQA